MDPFDAAWSILKAIVKPPSRKFEYLGTHESFDQDGRPLYRDIGVMHNINAVNGKTTKFPFYRSTGKSSKEPGTWKSFRGIATQPREVEAFVSPESINGRTRARKQKFTPSRDWFIKPQVTGDYTSPNYFGDPYGYDKDGTLIESNVKYPDKRVRYGHPAFEEHSDWMNENIGDQQFEQRIMHPAFINEALSDSGAVNLHDMAQSPTQMDRYFESRQ